MQVLVPVNVTDAVLTSSTATENDHAAWSAATAYAVGARVIRTSTHRIYERLIAGTTATAPELDPANWKLIGSTNRWAMFDRNAASYTRVTSPLTVVLAMPAAYNDLVLLGVVGTTVTVSVAGVVVRTVAVPAPAVSAKGSTVIVTGLGAAASALQVNLTGTGTVAIATLCAGTFTAAGDTDGTLNLGMLDGSSKAFDAAGNPQITPGPYASRQEISVSTPLATLDQLARVLTAVRSTPSIWLGVPSLPGAALYGWPREWTLLRRPRIARATIQLESLAVG